jgi:hypothetical protein
MTTIAPAQTAAAIIAYQLANQPIKLDVTKTATIRDWTGKPVRIRVRNFTLVG